MWFCPSYHLAGASSLPQTWGISSKSLQCHTALECCSSTYHLAGASLPLDVGLLQRSADTARAPRLLRPLEYGKQITLCLLTARHKKYMASTLLTQRTLTLGPQSSFCEEGNLGVHMARPKWWVNHVLPTVSQHLSSDLWISDPGVFPLRPQLTWSSDNSTHYGLSVFLALFRIMIDNCFMLR